MAQGRFVFSQVMDHLPMKADAFNATKAIVTSNPSPASTSSYAWHSRNSRESLRDIEACLRAHQDKLYHMGMSRNTLANANQRRDWRPSSHRP